MHINTLRTLKFYLQSEHEFIKFITLQKVKKKKKEY